MLPYAGPALYVSGCLPEVVPYIVEIDLWATTSHETRQSKTPLSTSGRSALRGPELNHWKCSQWISQEAGDVSQDKLTCPPIESVDFLGACVMQENG